MDVKTISPAEIFALQEEATAVALIDVREPDEFSQTSAPFAVNRPLSEIERSGVSALKASPADQTIYLICRSGQRSLKAARLMHAQGLHNVVNVSGGMMAWEQAGLPTVKR